VYSALRKEWGKALADSGGGEPPCDRCGWGGEDDNNRTYEVIFEDELPDDLEENCPRCGRELIQSIYFDDDPRAPWNATHDGT
jgi:hypothetical protein